MKKIQHTFIALLASMMIIQSSWATSETFLIDSKGSHAFIQFKISHLGYSFIYGRFNDFSGKFTVDPEAIEKSSVKVSIDTDSVDTNHAERDKHIKGAKFLDVKKYPKATFNSTKIIKTGEKTGKIIGDLTLHGVTKPITIDAQLVGHGKDPWGGYRAGFEGTTTIKPADFGIISKALPATMSFNLVVEGIKQ